MHKIRTHVHTYAEIQLEVMNVLAMTTTDSSQMKLLVSVSQYCHYSSITEPFMLNDVMTCQGSLVSFMCNIQGQQYDVRHYVNVISYCTPLCSPPDVISSPISVSELLLT